MDSSQRPCPPPGLYELLAQPNWVTQPNAETKWNCGPCQVGTVPFERPPHFWAAPPSLVDLRYAERRDTGTLGPSSQANWCTARDVSCGQATY